MFEYQELIERLSVDEVSSAVKKMVETYDLTGKFFDSSWDKEKTFKKFFNLSPDFIEFFESMVDDELPMIDRYFPDTSEVKPGSYELYSSLLKYLELEAKKILDDREYLRIPVGSKVDFDSCMLHNSYINKVEFYKDGGWGIAEEDGLVIVKNHMVWQPSQTRPILDNRDYLSCPYRIIQDRDTSLYGILSYESFYETVHCLYEEIEVEDYQYYNNSECHFFIKAKKNGKWGCFDEKCALIIDFKYDDISINEGYLECTKNAVYLPDGARIYADEYIFKGKYLYDRDGTLLFGGYDNLICSNNYFKIYFGTFYEYFPLMEFYGEWGERLNYERSICLVLDKDFKTVIRNKNGAFRMRKGQRFSSITEVEELIPSEFLLSHQVDISDLHEGFIYLKDYKYKGERICKDESVITILKLNENKEIAWTESANAIIDSDYDIHIYRKGTKYGVFDETGLKPAIYDAILKSNYNIPIYMIGTKYGILKETELKPAMYDAISRETPDGNIYVAVFESRNDSNTEYPDNPNYDSARCLFIRYYTLETNGELVRVEDNWDVFDPTESEWYPYDFVNKHYRKEIDDYSGLE